MTDTAVVHAHKAYIAELAGGAGYLQKRPARPALELFSDRIAELVRGVRLPQKRRRTLEIEAEEVQCSLINQAIRERTLIEYSRCIVAMEDALAPSNFDYVTEAAFKIFLGILASQGASVKTAGKYCAALYHFQLGCRYGLSPGEQPWASRESNATLRKMFSGFAFKAGEADSVTSRTGVIDEARVDEIDAWIDRETDIARQATDKRLAFGLRKVVQMALRQIEVRHARCEHYEPRERLLTIVRDKRNTAKAALPTGRFPIRRKWIVSEQAHKWLCDRQATANADDFIFDPKLYKVADMADLVKRAATALKWPADLKWCFHAARHGGDQDIEAYLKPTVAGLTSAAAALSPTIRFGSDAVRRAIAAGKAAMTGSLLDSATQQTAGTRKIYLAPVSTRSR